MFSGEGIFAYSYGTFRSYGSPADLLCGRIGAFDEAGCVRRFFERGKGWHADCDRDCADADRADGGGRGFAVIGISGGFWKPARNCAGTDGNPICAGSAQCCASVFQQRGGEPFAGSLQGGGLRLLCRTGSFHYHVVYRDRFLYDDGLLWCGSDQKTRYTLAGALFSSLVGMTVGVLLARLI